MQVLDVSSAELERLRHLKCHMTAVISHACRANIFRILIPVAQTARASAVCSVQVRNEFPARWRQGDQSNICSDPGKKIHNSVKGRLSLDVAMNPVPMLFSHHTSSVCGSTAEEVAHLLLLAFY